FVSFVSSMATAIVVVTLMQQAPEPVLQSITNVVEKTIERIVPTVVEKPGKTIVVKDEDLLVAAIERNNKSVVSFRVVGEDGEARLSGIGTIISSDGLVITDKANFGSGVLTTTIGGTKYLLEVISNEKEGSLGLGKLKLVSPTASGTTPVSFIPVTFGDMSTLKVGQTAIVLGGRDGKTITTGLITTLDTRTITNKDTKVETKVISNINLSQMFGMSSNGAPIITLNGLVIGFVSIDEATGSQSGVPVTEAKKFIPVTPVSATPATKKAQ
ncbi:MAG: hypothetical protein AAB628_00565, partial [Patescibacteria group bacterium]